MLEQLKHEIGGLYRRLMQVVVQGIVKLVDDTQNIQLMQLAMGAGYMRSNTLRVQNYGFSGNPPAGSFAVLLSSGGNISDAVIIACEHVQYRPKGLATGETQMYDNAGKYIYLSAAGIIIEAQNLPITINNATTVTINASVDVILNTPLLKVSGDIIDNYGTNPHTMAGMRGIYNSHYHGGVQTGSGNTNIPDNSM